MIVIRDPVDTFLSWFKWMPQLCCVPVLSMHEFYYDFYKWPERTQKDYYQCLLSWWLHRNNPRVLLLHYEDLIENLEFCIEKIAEFTQLSMPTDTSQRQRLIYQCTFQHMVKQEKTWGFDIKEVLGVTDAEWNAAGASASRVRKDGGTSCSGKLEVSDDIIADIAESFKRVIGSATGCCTYTELRGQSSLLLR